VHGAPVHGKFRRQFRWTDVYACIVAASTVAHAYAEACKQSQLSRSHKHPCGKDADLWTKIWSAGSQQVIPVAVGVFYGGIEGVKVGILAPVVVPFGLYVYMTRGEKDEAIAPHEVQEDTDGDAEDKDKDKDEDEDEDEDDDEDDDEDGDERYDCSKANWRA
jgi:hypothetical protein